MRVLHIGSMYPPHHFGGYELVWRSAVRHMRAAGHDARVLTTGFALPGGVGEPEDPDVHRELRWYWRDHDFPAMGIAERLSLERHNARVLARHLHDFPPDAVMWWAMGGMSLSLIERVSRAGLPALGVIGEHWPVYAPRVDASARALARRPLLRPLAALAGVVAAPDDLGAAARWLFISDHVREAAAAAGIDAPPSAVVHPGVDETRFSEAPTPEWRWRLLYAGRIDPRKGVLLCVEALAGLPAEATLRIDGDGDDAHLGELRRAIAEHGLEDRVEIARSGPHELQDRYAEADVTLFPVLWAEPWGLVPLESMAVGTPVVASGRGGSGEYMRDGENAVVVDPDEGPAALATAVRRLAEDEALRRRLRRGGLETAARYPQSAFDERILRELESLVLP